MNEYAHARKARNNARENIEDAVRSPNRRPPFAKKSGAVLRNKYQSVSKVLGDVRRGDTRGADG